MVLVWIVAVPAGPAVCPAILPAPRNCFVSQREATAVVMSVVMVVLWIVAITATLLAGRRPRSSRPSRIAWAVAVAGLVSLVLAAVASYPTVAWVQGLA